MAIKIKKPSQGKQGKSILFYGDPKTGKTTILGLDPSINILMLNLEGGESVLEDSDNVDVIDIETWEDLLEVGKMIRAGYVIADGEKYPIHTWDAVAMDSITRLQDLCKDYVVRVLAPNRRREVKGSFGAQSDWGNLKDDILGLVKGFQNLTKRGDQSINFIWLAHKMYDKDEDTGKLLATKIMLQGTGNAEIVMSYVDAVLYTFKRNKKDDKGKATDELEYGVSTKQMGIINADVRIPPTREQLPKVIINPRLGDILEKMNAFIPSRQK